MRLQLSKRTSNSRVDAAMTPMIDIVFQLLAFFILTFHIVSPEADFGISMPRVAKVGTVAEPHETVYVRLISGEAGNLADIRVNDRSLGTDTAALSRYFVALCGDGGPSSLKGSLEAELDCDEALRYEHTLTALANVSAFRDDAGRICPLVERVRLAR
jgi:biopolymer transport protein ExbD